MLIYQRVIQTIFKPPRTGDDDFWLPRASATGKKPDFYQEAVGAGARTKN